MYEAVDTLKEEVTRNLNYFIAEQRSKDLKRRYEGSPSREEHIQMIHSHTGVLDMFIDLDECMKMTSLNDFEIDELESNSLFPPRRPFTTGQSIWLLSDILDWMYNPTYITDYKT
ncbi:hypothetical protein [Pseudoalteromonas piscicida]|uniref:helix-turn-helix transcriptional regulator n=1 Tax=Pseudoalteromonas piscicida TaxID=43662 RepID=UPI0030B02204